MTTYSRRGDLAGPVLLIGFGTLLLLINLGRVPVSLWGAISQLWPLALVVLGLDLLIPRRSVLGSIVVAALLLVVLFAGAGLALPALTTPPSAVGGTAVEVPATGATAIDVTLSAGAGSIWVDHGAVGDALLSGTVNVPGGGQVTQSTETVGGTTTIMVKTTGVANLPVQIGGGEVWDIGLATDPALELSTEMGAGELHLDARELNLDSIAVSAGAGEVEVLLPAGESEVALSAAVGSLTVHVPEGTPVRLEASRLAGSVHVPDGYQRVGDAYLSQGFVPGDHIEIDVSLVFGMISVIEE